MTPESGPHRRPEKVPDWFPPWASQLADLYFSGTTAAFVLHGNTNDVFRIGAGEGSRYGVLAEFLAQQVFGRWSIVLHYDLGQGLRAYVGRDEQQRLKDMVALVNRKIGDLSALPKDPAAAFAVLDRFVRNNIMAADGDRLSLAVIMDQASYIFPSGEPGRLNLQASSELVTMLNWAMSPQVKKMNMAFVLVDERLSDVSDRLAGNPHVATIEVPLPDEPGSANSTSWPPAAMPPIDGVLGFRRGGAREADCRHLARGPQRPDSVGAGERETAGCRRIQSAQEAPARAAVPRPARVHRAEVGAGHRRRATRPRRCGSGKTRRCSSAARSIACRWGICCAVRSAPASRFSRSASAARSACRA